MTETENNITSHLKMCRNLGECARCHLPKVLCPSNAEMIIDENSQIILYCVTSLNSLAQQTCSGYHEQEEAIE